MKKKCAFLSGYAHIQNFTKENEIDAINSWEKVWAKKIRKLNVFNVIKNKSMLTSIKTRSSISS